MFSHLSSYDKNPDIFGISVKNNKGMEGFRDFFQKFFFSSREKKSKKIFDFFFSTFITFLTNLDALNTNLKTVLKSDFRFGYC